MICLFFLNATTQTPADSSTPCHQLSPYETFGSTYEPCVKKSIIHLVLPHFDLLMEVIQGNHPDRKAGIQHVTYVLLQILSPWHRTAGSWSIFREALRGKIQAIEDMVNTQANTQQRQSDMALLQELVDFNKLY